MNLKSQNRNNLSPAKLDVKTLFNNIDDNLNDIESLGIKCSKRNGKADDPKQKIAIDLATKIGLILLKKQHYASAYNVAYPLCNMTMGPRKSIAAITIAKALIHHKKGNLAKNMACLIAPLKGKLKIKTAKDIAVNLFQNKDLDNAKLVLKELQNNPTEYAQEAVKELNSKFQNNSINTSIDIKQLQKSDSAKVSNLKSLNEVDNKQTSSSEKNQKIIDSVRLILEKVKLENSSLFVLGKDGEYRFEMSLEKLDLNFIIDNQEKKYMYDLNTGECKIDGIKSKYNTQAFYKKFQKVLKDIKKNNCNYMKKQT